MKKSIRILARILCLAMIIALLTAVPAFAADTKPGPDDIADAEVKLVQPREKSWLDDYQKGFIYSKRGYQRAVNVYASSYTGTRFTILDQGSAITLLANEKCRYLIKADDGTIGWIDEEYYSDHYVARGRLKTDNAEVDANGPSLLDVETVRKGTHLPSAKEWLDEKVECYVYAPTHHRAAEMLYYKDKPTDAEAIAKGYKHTRQMGSVDQGTKITLLAHVGNRYFVKSEYDEMFWMYDWCTSDTYVPYGEAK